MQSNGGGGEGGASEGCGDVIFLRATNTENTEKANMADVDGWSELRMHGGECGQQTNVNSELNRQKIDTA